MSEDRVIPAGLVRLPEQPFETTVHMSDGTYVKSYKVPVSGTFLPQHSHAYSHTSYIAAGAVHVWKDGASIGTVVAPDGILIEARAKHMFQTLKDNTTLLCIHSVALGEDVEIVEEHQIAETV